MNERIKKILEELGLKRVDFANRLHISHASDKIMDFAAEIARNDDKEFRKRLVVMLADLEPKDWELLERIAEKLTT